MVCLRFRCISLMNRADESRVRMKTFGSHESIVMDELGTGIERRKLHGVSIESFNP